MRTLGHDPAPLFMAAGIPLPSEGEDPDARIATPAVLTLLDAAASATGDPNLALHIAQSAEVASYDLHAYAFLSSRNLGDGFDRLCRYQRLIHDTTRVVRERRGHRQVIRHLLPGGGAIPRHSAEFLIGSWVRFARLATQTQWAPGEVRFAHPAPPDAAEHARFFLSPVRFGTGENAIVADDAALAIPCTAAESGLSAMLDRVADEAMRKMPESPDSVADRVRRALLPELRGGEPTPAAAAAHMRVSVRTLQRQLAAEGTTFRDLLDQLRHELAIRHLESSRHAIGEIAFLLGFAEVSTFHRAFKRWAGKSPSEYRRGA
ncbi:MAG: AraC family transcriptional regulator [Candidatus Eisenbacteria bacterium]|uniref:AraC family transcriptional regulator n=1 Tax=Eiseniibacteriota bacterium TaxID=2212470 RepID=A0A956LYM2_UNCEI|nr:AraC family transcriptional regulator [Candidatus Eisenbacteria bacterium]